MSEEQKVSFQAFGHGAAAPADDLAHLHRALLPTSPLLLLGKGFLEGFYYRVLPEEGLIFGTVAYEQNRPVAFVVATTDSNGFLTAAIRRRWRTLLSSIVRRPPSPKGLWQAARLATSRGKDSQRDVGEILSLGVAPPELGGSSSSKVRRTLPRQLLESVLTELADQPVIALVDETNTSAKLMYGSLGWTVVDTVTAGWPIPQLVYRSPDEPATT
jgi:hypothetical protein